ncbi:MAG: trypsin-like peptidase domain-containing protein [Actinomycetota bacterium]|nr:trypsin-like peptidase domain-containing protein [Actinomycetota bacterium]
MSIEDEYGSRTPRLLPLLGALAACVGLAALGLAVLAYGSSRERASEMRALRGEVAGLHQRMSTLSDRNSALASRVKQTDQKLRRKDAGIAPVAARVLQSVFTIETDEGSYGAGFVAWSDDTGIYVLTANHVVARAANPHVTLARKGGSWDGAIVATDKKNDLALVRLQGRPAKATPLWESNAPPAPPRAGDELLLVGNPYGLEGTVTTGIVSRVTKKEIQTDAAANPGNSGGPALDKQGHIVGVLVSGAGENLNFVVPIARVCVKLRKCA